MATWQPMNRLKLGQFALWTSGIDYNDLGWPTAHEGPKAFFGGMTDDELSHEYPDHNGENLGYILEGDFGDFEVASTSVNNFSGGVHGGQTTYHGATWTFTVSCHTREKANALVAAWRKATSADETRLYYQIGATSTGPVIPGQYPSRRFVRGRVGRVSTPQFTQEYVKTGAMMVVLEFHVDDPYFYDAVETTVTWYSTGGYVEGAASVNAGLGLTGTGSSFSGHAAGGNYYNLNDEHTVRGEAPTPYKIIFSTTAPGTSRKPFIWNQTTKRLIQTQHFFRFLGFWDNYSQEIDTFNGKIIFRDGTEVVEPSTDFGILPTTQLHDRVIGGSKMRLGYGAELPSSTATIADVLPGSLVVKISYHAAYFSPL